MPPSPSPERAPNSRDGEESDSLLEAGQRRAKRVVDGFLDFALQGNILEIAFGLILAAAFTSVVTSFVSDMLLPPLSVLLPLNKNMDEKFVVLRRGPHFDELGGYNTVEIAQSDGAVVMTYGAFIAKVINFMAIGIALYGLAGVYQFFSKDPIIKHTIKCKYCRKRVNEKALRCINCTSWLDGREERMH